MHVKMTSLHENLQNLSLSDANTATTPNLTQISETFGGIVRTDWKDAPENLSEVCFTELDFGTFLNVDQMSTSLDETLISFEGQRETRPPMTFINAFSGAGKSAMMQFFNNRITEEMSDRYLPLAVTFNFKTRDHQPLDPEQGLVLRIVYQFMVKDDVAFQTFFENWTEAQADYLKSIALVDLLHEILVLLGNKKIVVLVDEAGKALVPRSSELSSDYIARRVVDATSFCRRGETGRRGTIPESERLTMGDRVHFIFSSLNPLYTENELTKETLSGSPIYWRDVPTPSSDITLIDKIGLYLKDLGERMPDDDFDLVCQFVIALSGDAWAILILLLHEIVPDQGRVGKFEQILYFPNVRDVLVRSRNLHKYIPCEFTDIGELLAYSIVGYAVDPFRKKFRLRCDDDTDKKEYTLADLIFRIVVLNSIGGQNRRADRTVPRLSIFAVRRWIFDALFDTPTEIVAPTKELLQWAGHDGTNPNLAKKSFSQPSLAYEKLCVQFLHCKLLAWKSYDVGGEHMRLSAPQSFSLFPSYNVYRNAPRAGGAEVFVRRPPSSRILSIEGTGGFRSGAPVLTRMQRESPTTFENRCESTKKVWRETAIRFEVGQVSHLREGDFIVPGKKNQAYADFLVILKNTAGEFVLCFVQNKYTSHESSTRLGHADVTKALDLLMIDRGVLFAVKNVAGSTVRNQIALLRVKEENVILCFAVLHNLKERQTTMETNVNRWITSNGFSGRVLVAGSAKDGAAMFGPTFQNMALVVSSAAHSQMD